MNIIVLSRVLMITFVTTVTMWYFVTPYIVQPHPKIVTDLVNNGNIFSVVPNKKAVDSGWVVIENWTKWRIYVLNPSGQQIIHSGTADTVRFNNSKTVMRMEWRPDHEIEVEESQGKITSQVVAPLLSFHRWGIYNHIITEVNGRTVRVIPRFLFGIPFKTVTSIYSNGEEEVDASSSQSKIFKHLPIIGVFSQSTHYDRIIIQAYMNLVTMSVIFLLYVNNPPTSLVKSVSSAEGEASEDNTPAKEQKDL